MTCAAPLTLSQAWQLLGMSDAALALGIVLTAAWLGAILASASRYR